MNELPPDVRDFLTLASSVGQEAPDGAAERVKQRLALTVGGAAALEAGRRAAEGGQAATHATTLAPALKIAVVTLCAAGLGTVGWLWRGKTDSADASTAGRVPAAQTSPAEPVLPPTAAPPTSGEPAANPAQSNTVATPAPATATPSQSVPSLRNRDGERLRGELELLKAASSALEQSDVERARRLLRRHRTQFPRGTLLNERRALEVLASCLEQGASAQAQAEAFLRETSHSFVSARIRAACHLEPTE